MANKIKRALYSNTELYDRFLDVHIDGDNLKGYKVAELQEMLETFGESITGRKQDLINRVIERLYHDFYPVYLKQGNIYYMNNQAWEYSVINGLDDTLTRKVIRIMERGHLVYIRKENKWVWADYDSYQACNDIINSGFTDVIYDDCFQSVRVYLWECFMSGKAYICNGRIKFSTIDFSENYSAFSACYSCVFSVLSSYRATYNKRSKDSSLEHMISYDEDGKEIYTPIDDSKCIPLLANMINPATLEHEDLMSDFYDYCVLKYPKVADDIVLIIKYRMLGYKDKEIKAMTHITGRTLERRSALMKVIYLEYVADGGKAFIFEHGKRESAINRYDVRKITPTKVVTMWENSDRYDGLCTDYSKRIVAKNEDTLKREKRLRYECYKEYKNKRFEGISGGHDFALVMMKKQYPRNAHGIVYA